MRLADRVRQELEQDILTSALPPGTRLDEARLADRFQVSRTPIREALLQLSASGLVRQRPRQGAVVAQLGTKRMLEMFEVMAHLEGLCARLAARRMTPEEQAVLVELHKDCAAKAEANTADAYYAANMAFHEAIYAGSHNEFLELETKQIRQRLSPYRRVQLRRAGRIGESYQEHTAVVKAILAGEGDEAEALMSSHVSVQSDVFTDLLLESSLELQQKEPAPLFDSRPKLEMEG
ncbi:GntR family transcriptional regulator [Rhodovibrionaceae bacterium A322]